ncbi:MAG: LacI family transcriptional regulator [Ramlibacter sp.]|nr:LacI family transcriptional regulator [Ramlibacter sp.]
MKRRNCIALLAASPLAAWAQASPGAGWPKGSITIVVPLAAGDGGDTTARAMGDELSKELGVPVVVTNRPGAGGALGVQQVVAAKKDGYTLLFTQNSPLTIRRALEPATVTYDPLRELTPLAITTRTPSVLVVRKDAPYDTFQEMVAHAKKNPGSVRIGTPGGGSAGDLGVQVVNTQAGTDLASIPYKGAAPAVSDALGGQVEGVILALGILASHIRSGALKPLATSHPFPELPKVPTLTQLGFRQNLVGVWFAWMAPAGTPPEVAQVLLPALQKVTRQPQIAARLLPLGLVQAWEPGDKLAAEISEEHDMVADLAKRMGKKP